MKKKKKTTDATKEHSKTLLCNAPVICNHCPSPHLRGWEGDSRANVRGSDLLSSPAVPGKCRACDITQIYPGEIYYYKEHGYDTQQLPAVQGF